MYNTPLPSGAWPYRAIIGGMPHAGSTLCCNLARLLAENAGYSVAVHTSDEDEVHVLPGINQEDKRLYSFSKQHDLAADAILYEIPPKDLERYFTLFNVKRDLRDTVASGFRKLENKNEFDLMQMCERNIQWHSDWKEICDYEWVYEAYKQDPLKIVNEMQDAFGFELPEVRLLKVIHGAEILKNLLNKNDAQDQLIWNVARMRSDQITNNGKIGGYKDTLTSEQIEFIESRHGDWLKEHGYIK